MKRLVLGLVILCAFSFSVFSQNANSDGLKTAELLSPISSQGQGTMQNIRDFCFSFITESVNCGKSPDLYYGMLRKGNDWDWFRVMGEGSRNKIRNLGKKDWTDDFKVPVVKPYAKLKDGQQRNVVVGSGNSRMTNASGEPDKTPRQLDRFGNTDKSTILPDISRSSDTRTSGYNPFVKAVAGNMYVMRVLNETNDFYVLFRVDEIERGKRVKISWKKIPAPKED